MEPQQMMEFLLAMQAKADARYEEAKINQAKADADRKAMQERTDANMKTSHKELLAKLEDDRQANMKAWRGEMSAMTDKWGSDSHMETMACQVMEARRDEEPSSVDRKPEVAQKVEFPVVDAEVMPVREPKRKRRRDRHLAEERRRQKTKDSRREIREPQKKLTVAHRRTTRRLEVAQKTQIDQKVSRRATVR
ncbi:hypothetical protein B7P43_G09688 [Cryptotermes secundus]|uniref:Uncharacterized protein n=1 Tax=Cryptotermes secundus TaxID=105785 RepID=A0A2J7Q785_9NEOP|nr:hypothetical protein B7P43_G09688 [Cryptotermes secundus]